MVDVDRAMDEALPCLREGYDDRRNQRAVHRLKCGFATGVISHLDKAKALRAVEFTVLNDRCP